MKKLNVKNMYIYIYIYIYMRFGIRDGWISESIKNMDFFMPFHATYTFAAFATNVTNIAIRHWANRILTSSVH